MLFCDPIYFLVLLPLTALIYWRVIAKGKFHLAIPVLLVGSTIFYCTWNWRFYFLLLLSALVNYRIGRIMLTGARSQEPGVKGKGSKAWLLVGLLFNLGLLGYFKYAGFFLDNYNALFGTHWNVGHIILPLGISFYTFQQIAYLVDAYRREVPLCSFPKYLLFVTFFPQLVAGPIVHYKEMIPQFGAQRTVAWDSMYRGLWVFAFGLFKKVVLADTLAPYVDKCWSNVEQLQFLGAWTTVLGYTLQLYFDFSGYADMAIGSGLIFGIRLPENFNSPYQALNIQDFWRRWHMTLSAWLKDYVYIPLGGSRCPLPRTCINLFLTFLIGGIWHGANWTFVIWGALHGFAIVLHRLWHKTNHRLNAFAAWLLTFAFVNFAWIFFRAPNLKEAWMMVRKAVGVGTNVSNFVPVIKNPVQFGTYIVLFSIIALLCRNTSRSSRRFYEHPHLLKSFFFILFIVGISYWGFYHKSSEFLYWNF